MPVRTAEGANQLIGDASVGEHIIGIRKSYEPAAGAVKKQFGDLWTRRLFVCYRQSRTAAEHKHSVLH